MYLKTVKLNCLTLGEWPKQSGVSL